jgi:REP element-mobilizing transposase RayT
MPRGPRFVFENAFYHVFNRGINKQAIFINPADYSYFLKKLSDLKRKFDYSLYAYCLMPNHFHLSIQTRKVSISKIMASLMTSFSMYFNRVHNHFGPVFQNRYKSILIETDPYFLQLSKYIYLNPVRAGITQNPTDYKYSSIREALGQEPLYFLDKDITRLIGETRESQREYKKFIYEGLNEDLSHIEELFEKEEATFGTSRFSTLSQKKYLRRKQRSI